LKTEAPEQRVHLGSNVGAVLNKLGNDSVKSIKWAFQIERTGLGQRNLIDLLNGIGFQEVDVPGLDLAFWSKTFENCGNASEVWDEAKKVRDLLSEVTEIDPELIMGPVIDLSSGKPKRHIFVEAKSGIITMTSFDATLTVSPPDNLTEEQLIEYNKRRAEKEYQIKLEAQRAKLEPAFREPRAAKLLQLLKLDSHTGESLYKIYELAEGHPSNRKIFLKQFGISEDDFKRFSDAVHNPVVSGDLARHAYEDQPKTDNPMTIAEAKSFVMEIAKRWLASLCN